MDEFMSMREYFDKQLEIRDRLWASEFEAHADKVDALDKRHAQLLALNAELSQALKGQIDIEFSGVYKDIQAADKRYEQRFIAQEQSVTVALVSAEKAVQSALVANEKALIKAETATEKRFEAVNEFRGQLSDQAARLMNRAEAEARFKSIDEKVETLQTRVNVREGIGAGAASAWNNVYLLIMAGIAVLGFLIVYHK